MKIYFAGSITGGRQDVDLYSSMIKELNRYGKVLDEHIGDSSITDKGEIEKDKQFVYRRDMNWLTEADMMVAEVTTPSLGVGFEIGRAQSMGKNVLCFYRPNNGRTLSLVISGNPEVKIFNYTDFNDFSRIIGEYFKIK
ncbi:MAG: nucleoside 2-deoxyribosyltransferase [Candidatus Paceibacterota bacterium]|jgi:nucleoside 2-deoxyribosyltransferase